MEGQRISKRLRAMHVEFPDGPPSLMTEIRRVLAEVGSQFDGDLWASGLYRSSLYDTIIQLEEHVGRI